MVKVLLVMFLAHKWAELAVTASMATDMTTAVAKRASLGSQFTVSNEDCWAESSPILLDVMCTVRIVTLH